MHGRTLWVHRHDVAGPLDVGCIVRAARPLNHWCLRADDGSDPVAAGTALAIVEDRAGGASMAMELPALSEVENAESTSADADAWIKAAQQLQALGLYQVVAS